MTTMKTGTAKPSKEDVILAMEILLNKKQIKYVKSRTFSGPSKVQIIRNLINIGIKQEERLNRRFGGLSNERS